MSYFTDSSCHTQATAQHRCLISLIHHVTHRQLLNIDVSFHWFITWQTGNCSTSTSYLNDSSCHTQTTSQHRSLTSLIHHVTNRQLLNVDVSFYWFITFHQRESSWWCASVFNAREVEILQIKDWHRCFELVFYDLGVLETRHRWLICWSYCTYVGCLISSVTNLISRKLI